jgi:hypothetical protein
MKPRSFNDGPMRAQISLFAVRQFAVARRLPPTCMLERANRCSAGTRLIAPDRLAVDQDDALVAGRCTSVEVFAATMNGSRYICAKHFQERGHVAVTVGLDVEHAGAAIAVERLEDHVADFARGRR